MVGRPTIPRTKTVIWDSIASGTTVAIRNDSSTENINRDKQAPRSTLPLVMELQRYVEKVSKISLYENEDSQQRKKERRNDKLKEVRPDTSIFD